MSQDLKYLLIGISIPLFLQFMLWLSNIIWPKLPDVIVDYHDTDNQPDRQ